MKLSSIKHSKFTNACRLPKKHFSCCDNIFEIRSNAAGIDRNNSKLFLKCDLGYTICFYGYT